MTSPLQTTESGTQTIEHVTAFDTSSLNALRDDPRHDHVIAALPQAGYRPALSAYNVLEVLKWDNHDPREHLLELMCRLRDVGNLRLLPYAHDLVASEFEGWLRDEPIRVGGEPSAEAMYWALVNPSNHRPDVVLEAQRVASEREASLQRATDRLQAKQVVPGERGAPATETEFIARERSDGTKVAAILHYLFGDQLAEHPPLTPEESLRCILTAPSINAYWVTLCVASWRHGVLRQSMRQGIKGRRPPGAIDIEQATYLARIGHFVVDDLDLRDRLATVADFIDTPASILSYQELRRSVLG